MVQQRHGPTPPWVRRRRRHYELPRERVLVPTPVVSQPRTVLARVLKDLYGIFHVKIENSLLYFDTFRKALLERANELLGLFRHLVELGADMRF